MTLGFPREALYLPVSEFIPYRGSCMCSTNLGTSGEGTKDEPNLGERGVVILKAVVENDNVGQPRGHRHTDSDTETMSKDSFPDKP